MAAGRALCAECRGEVRVTGKGRPWGHPGCPGRRQTVLGWTGQRWPDRHYGRPVVTLPDIAQWSPAA